MDGTLAVIFVVASLTDMALNDCPTGCVDPDIATPRLSFQASAVQFQDKFIGQEAYISYDFGWRYGPFQPVLGASVTDTGDTWIGAGAKWTTANSYAFGPYFVEASLMPGYYASGDGPDIGGAMQFRSALGFGYIFDDSATLTVLYDHRSNADTRILNPGLETLGIRYAISF